MVRFVSKNHMVRFGPFRTEQFSADSGVYTIRLAETSTFARHLGAGRYSEFAVDRRPVVDHGLWREIQPLGVSGLRSPSATSTTTSISRCVRPAGMERVVEIEPRRTKDISGSPGERKALVSVRKRRLPCKGSQDRCLDEVAHDQQGVGSGQPISRDIPLPSLPR